jgi:hypothetical protein
MVVPLTLLESNPALKAQIFKGLRENGIEDPEQYVVGSNANSINPETGLMEFGFFSKVWKSVKGLVKMVAPIVLPIALAFTPLGAIYGAALGSGIGTLINGGSIKDALKASLIAGATGAVFQGFTGGTAGVESTFAENVQAGLANPGGRIGQTIAGAETSVGNVFGSEATKLANATGGAGRLDWSAGAAKPGFFSAYSPTATAALPSKSGLAPTTRDIATTPTGVEPWASGNLGGKRYTVPAGQPVPPVSTVTALSGQVGEAPGFFESLMGAFNPNDDIGFVQGLGDAFFPKGPTAADLIAADPSIQGTGTVTQMADAAAAAKAMAPTLVRTYAPLAGLSSLVGAAGGAFDTPEMDMPGLVQREGDGTVTTGADLIAADPGKYLVRDLGGTRLNPETGKYETVLDDEVAMGAHHAPRYTAPTSYPLQQQAVSRNGYLRAAEGGPVFPRRKGGIAPTEGVHGQDSVQAMLMPGEFVMTTDAVRGLGNGSLNDGIKSMYSVMRNLESRGRATA